MRYKEELDTTTNKHVYRVAYKQFVSHKTGQCSYCSWHGGENSSPQKKWGVKKSKKKNKRHVLEYESDSDIKYIMGQFDKED